jgi:predicted alpha/beta-fold hydrolase
VTLEYPADGGHVGFPGRANDAAGLGDTLSWLPHRVLSFLDGHG